MNRRRSRGHGVGPDQRPSSSLLDTCGDVQHLTSLGRLLLFSAVVGVFVGAVVQRRGREAGSGLVIDLNECRQQLIARRDFLLSFPREFLFWCWPGVKSAAVTETSLLI